MAELRDPRDYPKSLCLLQGIDICLYLVASVVIYVYAGQDVTSPALGSASPVVRKVAYGVALPTVNSLLPFSPLVSYPQNQPLFYSNTQKIITAGVVNGHVACKYVYVRIFRNSDRMHSRDLIATGSWVAIGFVVWILAWIIAEAIPVFDNLLSLIASLFASWFTCKLRCQRVCIVHANCLLQMVSAVFSGFI